MTAAIQINAADRSWADEDHMTKTQKEAFDLGVSDGKRSWSGTNPYTFSVLMDFYCKGFEAGSREFYAAA